MFLSENGERITVGPATNGFGRRLATAVIYDDDLKERLILLRQRLEASAEHCPIVVDTDDDAEQRRLVRRLVGLNHKLVLCDC